MRNDGRRNDELRPIQITRQFTKTPAGSILWQQGETIVLCTASVTSDLPPWMERRSPRRLAHSRVHHASRIDAAEKALAQNRTHG